MDDIVIKELNGQKAIIVNDKKVGTVRKFCCGIDFRIDEKPRALFSILGLHKYSDKKLIKCIKALLSIKIPDRSFHWNFRYETAIDNELLKKYSEKLNG